MSADTKKRQKKLEKKAAKRKEKKHQLVRSEVAGPLQRLATVVKHPILDCVMSDHIATTGIGWVILSREAPNGMVGVAAFLVDAYCLGVKNITANVISRPAYNRNFRQKMGKSMRCRDVAPAEARKFIEEAVAYARNHGIEPHEDYEKTMVFFGATDPAESQAKFTFGKDGKPFFFAGPNDSPSRCQQIMQILTDKLGLDGFHFTIPIHGSTDVKNLSEEEWEEIKEDEELGKRVMITSEEAETPR